MELLRIAHHILVRDALHRVENTQACPRICEVFPKSQKTKCVDEIIHMSLLCSVSGLARGSWIVRGAFGRGRTYSEAISVTVWAGRVHMLEIRVYFTLHLLA
jgi:hypothetical protein